MLRVALPNKGTLAEPAATMMREAGYRQRSDPRDLSIADEENDIEFFYLRPKDIATYVGSGDLQLGVTGATSWTSRAARCRACSSWASAHSKFRFAAPDDGEIKSSKTWRASGSPPRTRAWCARTWPAPGSAPRSSSSTARWRSPCSLGLADAIADVVSSGRTLRQHGLVAFGEPIAESEATLIEREPRPDREQTAEVGAMKRVFTERLRGVVLARQYLMMEYDCPKTVDAAVKITPGPAGADDLAAGRRQVGGRAVHGQAAKANKVMDQLAALGAKAILTTDIRSCRALEDERLGLTAGSGQPG